MKSYVWDENVLFVCVFEYQGVRGRYVSAFGIKLKKELTNSIHVVHLFYQTLGRVKF